MGREFSPLTLLLLGLWFSHPFPNAPCEWKSLKSYCKFKKSKKDEKKKNQWNLIFLPNEKMQNWKQSGQGPRLRATSKRYMEYVWPTCSIVQSHSHVIWNTCNFFYKIRLSIPTPTIMITFNKMFVNGVYERQHRNYFWNFCN